MSTNYGRSYNPVDDRSSSGSGPEISLKILLVAMFGVVLLLLLCATVHVYVRWAWVSSGWSRAADQVQEDPERMQEAAARGLDKGVLEALSTFVYTKESTRESTECSVCISQFQENETGRLLPKCNHCFHTACIDMWFQSHSSCPLCRAAVGEEPISPEDVEKMDMDEEMGVQDAPSHDVTVELNSVPNDRNLAQEQIIDDMLKNVSGVQETFSAEQQHEDPHSNPHIKLKRENPSVQYPMNTLFHGDQNHVSWRLSSRSERFNKLEHLVIEVPSRSAIYPSTSATETTPAPTPATSALESKTPLSHLKTIKRILSMRESWRSSVPTAPKTTYQFHQQGMTTP